MKKVIFMLVLVAVIVNASPFSDDCDYQTE